MSEQESLRLAAELVDNFSPTMRKLRSQMQDMAKAGAEHTAAVARGFGKAEAALHATAKTASTVLNPALATVGITSLSLGATIAGVGASLRSFATSASALGSLSRETGVAAQNIAAFGAAASKFGVDQGAAASVVKTFTGNMRELGRATGETYKWLNQQGTNASGRKAFQDFAEDLRKTTDDGERLEKSLSFMETLSSGTERGIFAQHVFGNADIGKMADGHLGKIGDVLKKAKEKVGPITEKDIIDAEKFEQSMADLRTSMDKTGRAIARDLLGPASDFTKWIDDIVSGNRADFTKSMREGLDEVKKSLSTTDWKKSGDDFVTFLRTTTTLAGSLASALKTATEFAHALSAGDYASALRATTGGAGTVGRILNKVAPTPDRSTPETEALDAMMRGQPMTPEQLRGNQNLRSNAPRVGEIETRQAEIQGKLNQFGLMEKGGTTGDRSRQQADELRREMGRLTEELKRIREGAATAQKSSLEDGGGTGLGGLIHTAGYRFPSSVNAAGRIMRGYGGGSGPGYGGEQGPAGGGAGRTHGGGRFNGLGGGGGGSPVPHIPAYPPDHPVNRAGRIARGEPEHAGGGFGGRGSAKTGDMMRYAMDQLRKEGVPEEHLRGAAAHLVGQAQMESGLNPNLPHDGGTGFGIYGARDDPRPRGSKRRSAMFSWLEANGYARNSAEGQMREMAHRAMTGGYGNTKRILMGGGSGDLETDTNAITREFEAPAKINRRSGAVREALRTGPSAPGSAGSDPKPGEDSNFFPNGAPRVLKPDSMPDAPGLTMKDVENLRAKREAITRRSDILSDPNDERRKPGSDGFWTEDEDARAQRDLGIALRARRKDLADTIRQGQAAAARSPLSGGAKLEANGSVVVNVHKPGPDTSIRATSSGKLFQEVKTQDGRQMRKAE